jgi:hypothetical protein
MKGLTSFSGATASAASAIVAAWNCAACLPAAPAGIEAQALRSLSSHRVRERLNQRGARRARRLAFLAAPPEAAFSFTDCLRIDPTGSTHATCFESVARRNALQNATGFDTSVRPAAPALRARHLIRGRGSVSEETPLRSARRRRILSTPALARRFTPATARCPRGLDQMPISA